MRLNSLARLLLFDNNSSNLFERAIHLFEFQVAVFYPVDFRKLTKSDDESSCLTEHIKRVRVLASIRVLEALNSNSTIIPDPKARRESYKQVEQNFFAPSREFSQIFDQRSAASVVKSLEKRKKNAAVVAQFIDAACRIASTTEMPKYKGVIMLTNNLIRTDLYHCDLGRTQISTHWVRFRRTSIFMYLLMMHWTQLLPPHVTDENFLSVLIGQTQNVEQLRCFFCQYQQVRNTLKRLNVKKFRSLNTDLRCDSPPLVWNPFSLEQIDKASRNVTRERDGQELSISQTDSRGSTND
jgi:hypothetical protein